MEEIIIVLYSSTTASRLKEMLAKERISSSIMQTPKKLSIGGCSYSIRTTRNALHHLDKIMNILNAKYKDIFKIKHNKSEVYYERM